MSGVTIWEAAGANGGAKASLERLTSLVQQGESLNQPNWAGCTPLHCSAPEVHFSILKFLVDNGADVNKTTPYGLTPLHFACYYGRLENAQLLIAHGADIHARTHDGFTPKDKALEGQKTGRGKGPGNNFAEVIDLLTQCEANPQHEQQLRQKFGIKSASSTPRVGQGSVAVSSAPASAPPPTAPSKPQGPASQSSETDLRVRSFLEHLEKLVNNHRLRIASGSSEMKEDRFQEMLQEVVWLASSFQKAGSAPSPSALAPPAAATAQPVASSSSRASNKPPVAPSAGPPPPSAPPPTPAPSVAPSPMPAPRPAAPHPQTVIQPQPQPASAPIQWYQEQVAPSIPSAAPALPPERQVAVYENQQPDPTADYYTQQYQRYLEHVKSGSRSSAVFSGDYYTSGAPARTLYAAQSQAASPYSAATYSAPAAAAAPATTRPPQTFWPPYSTVYQPPQHQAYGATYTAPSFSYAHNPLAPTATAPQIQYRW